MQKEVFKIVYRSILDGFTYSYMNIGFKSKEQAQKELDKLKREYNKKWKRYTNEEIMQMSLDGVRMTVPAIGRDYKIEPVKLRPL